MIARSHGCGHAEPDHSDAGEEEGEGEEKFGQSSSAADAV